MADFCERLLEKLKDEQPTLEILSPFQFRSFLVTFMASFFGQDAAIQTPNEADFYSDSKNKPDEVNEIIMKIEMRKFQKLIENRVQHKNALLKADITRLYPICNFKIDQNSRKI